MLDWLPVMRRRGHALSDPAAQVPARLRPDGQASVSPAWPHEAGGLRRLLQAMLVVEAAYAAFLAGSWLLTGNHVMGAGAAIDGAAMVACGVVWILAARGRVATAVMTLGVGIVGLAIPLATVLPATPALVSLPLLGAAIVLPHVGGREMRILMTLSWLASVLAAVTVELVPAVGAQPGWYHPLMRVFSVAAVVGITMVLLGQFASRLRETLAVSEAARSAAESAAEALQASEARSRLLVEEAVDWIFRGLDGRFIDVNAAGCAMLGYTREELLGRGWKDVADASETSDLPLPLDELSAGHTISVERRFRRKDGSMILGDLRARLLPDGSMLGSVRDVTGQRAAQMDRAFAVRVDAALTKALRQVPPDAGLEETAQALCETLGALPGLDFVAVEAFAHGDEVIELAHVPAAFPTPLGGGLPPHRAREIREARGPFAQYWRSVPEDGEWGEQVSALGLRALAVGPIVHADHVDGDLVIGTRDADFARTLVERLPGLASMTAMSSGLLAPRIHARRTAIELGDVIRETLRRRRFHPVFQPIVDLATHEVVGHEALTRFDSGQRPDLCFADAWSVGLGVELELAALSAAIEAATRLPAGRWLDLNVSSHLLTDARSLGAMLRRSDRPIVLEITEHEAIDHYSAVRDAVRGLGRDIRLAVDDSGAGVANFGHIVELRPDFVKLDASIVRAVNVNLERQALVVAMRYFARSAGCRLIAEGIETEAEARTLTSLGVEFGQGFWLGRPQRARVIASTRSPGRVAGAGPRRSAAPMVAAHAG